MKNHKKIKIEGDFIDSFLYSGSLFLLGTDLTLSSYAWNELVDNSNAPPDKKIFLEQIFCNQKTTNFDGVDDVYFIYEDILNNCKLDSFQLNAWPTDLDIYKNKFLISSAEGISTIVGNRTEENKKPIFKFSDQAISIWTEKVFELAVGNLDRLIISCGKEGAFELFTKTTPNSYSLTNERELSSSEWVGCEWDINTGIAILKNKLEQKHFQFKTIDDDIINSITEKKEKKEYLKSIEQEEPLNLETPSEGKKFINSWVLDDKLYFFDEVLGIYEYSGEHKLKHIEQIDTNTVDARNIIDSAKTQYGLLFEDINNLYLYDKSISQISSNVTNWRTYPKSKNYQNHLHIVENDYLTIQAFEL